MPIPQTLLQLAGVDPVPHPLSESAIVMIDAQTEYLAGRLPLAGIEAALERGAALLDRARATGRPVIHIAQEGRPGGAFDPGGPGFAIAAPVAPRAGERVIRKRLPNAFAGTDLDAVLKERGIASLIVAGFMTHMCVSSTVRGAALDLGYGCTVVGSACATRDLPDGAGGVVPAATLHRAELAALADRFAVVVADAAALPIDTLRRRPPHRLNVVDGCRQIFLS